MIRNFLRKFSPDLLVDNIIKTPNTSSSVLSITKKKPNGTNDPGTIQNKQIRRLGFTKGEGQVPDDFNTMGAKEIEDLFLKGR
jgi:hypothetical protein